MFISLDADYSQWSGINAIIYYAPTIFQQIGLTGGTIPLLATGYVEEKVVLEICFRFATWKRIGPSPI